MPEMSEPETVVAAPALGPGDADPLSRARGEAGEAAKPLAPGDDDGVVRESVEARRALGPGDGPDAVFDMMAQPAPGPGEMTMPPRRLTIVPKSKE